MVSHHMLISILKLESPNAPLAGHTDWSGALARVYLLHE